MSATERLAGKVAIVTGAGDGLGEAIARAFAAAGANLALLDINADKLDRVHKDLEASGTPVVSLCGNAAESASASQLVEMATQRFGAIDILVNNVGIATVGKLWELSEEDWDRVIATNLRSAFLFSKAVLPGMIERRAGRIICLSSGAREGTPWLAARIGGTPYATTKAGVHGFIRQLALEVAPYGINVNAIAPGPMNTPVGGAAMRAWDESGDPYSPSRLTPLGRLGEPREVADAAVFLASGEASYITGVTLPVMGGR